MKQPGSIECQSIDAALDSLRYEVACLRKDVIFLSAEILQIKKILTKNQPVILSAEAEIHQETGDMSAEYKTS